MGGRRVRPGVARATAALAASALVAAGVAAATAAGASAAQSPPTITVPTTTVPGPTIPTTTVPGPTIPTTTVPGPTIPTTTSTTAPTPSTTSVTTPSTSTSSTTAPEPPAEATLTATPSTGLAPGDTVTVTGAGFAPNEFVGLSVCLEEAVGVPGIPWGLCEVAVDFPEVDDAGSFTTELVVETPAWELIHALAPSPNTTATAPIDVADPAAPELVLELSSTDVVTGDYAYANGYAWPRELAADAREMTCADVPASATDRAAVEAACGPIAEAGAPSAGTLGSVYAALPTRPGDEALWVGIERDDGSLLGVTMPVNLLPPPAPTTVVVTPSEDLVDGQTVAVSGSGAVVTSFPGYVVEQCAGAVLDDERVDYDEVVSSCDAEGPPTWVDVAEDGTFTSELDVKAELLATDGDVVDCTDAPGACAVVVYEAYGDPLYRSGGTPVSFRPVPPVVTLHAARVTEGDAGVVAAEVPVRLDEPSATPVTVAYTTFDAPALPWAATYGEDAEPAEGTIVLAPGEVEATITVPILGDTAVEGEEMALVGIASADGATVGGFAGIGGVVIDDDD